MACSQTLNGLVRDCEKNVGGIKAIYIANIDDVASVALDSTGEKIGTLTMVTSKKFKGFYFKKGQASMEVTPQFNELGEYAGEQPVITVNFGRMDTTKRAQMNALSLGELAVIVLDNNGMYWYIGYDQSVLRTGGNAQTGSNKTDTNQYALELTGDDNQLPYEVEATVAEGVIE